MRRPRGLVPTRVESGGRLGDLIAAMKAGRVNWVMVATFDRRGIQNADKLFEFRDRFGPCVTMLGGACGWQCVV